MLCLFLLLINLAKNILQSGSILNVQRLLKLKSTASRHGTERFYLKCSRLNATFQRSTFRNNTERSGTMAFPCERDLQHHSEHTTLKQQNTFQKGHTFFGFQFFSLSLQQIPNSSLGLNVHSTTNSII